MESAGSQQRFGGFSSLGLVLSFAVLVDLIFPDGMVAH